MPGPSARSVVLSPSAKAEFEEIARSTTAPFRTVQRATIALLAAQGRTNVDIAMKVGCTERTVRSWRSRLSVSPCSDTLEDRPRSGRPATVPIAVRCELIKLACKPPSEVNVPHRSIWTQEALRQALAQDTGVKLSRSEVCRILNVEDLRPHRMRLWLHSPDPEFRPKVERVCELYCRPPAGATVLCIDEKTCIQALGRKHPTKVALPGRAGRFEFEYIRHGTRTLLAAFNTGTGEVFGQVRERRTANDLQEFVEALAQHYPTGEVFVVWDNLNIHHGQAWQQFNERHGGRFHFVYTPKHASWMNQVEIWFGILQKRVLTYGEFPRLDALQQAIEGFIAHWNRSEAHPFRWTFRGRFHQHRPKNAA